MLELVFSVRKGVAYALLLGLIPVIVVVFQEKHYAWIALYVAVMSLSAPIHLL